MNFEIPGLIFSVQESVRMQTKKCEDRADLLKLSHVRLVKKGAQSSALRFVNVSDVARPDVPKNSKYCLIQSGLQIYLLHAKVQLDDLDILNFVKVQQK
jgi:hypothetical protein